MADSRETVRVLPAELPCVMPNSLPVKAPLGSLRNAAKIGQNNNILRVLSATFILSKNSRVLDAKPWQKSANLG